MAKPTKLAKKSVDGYWGIGEQPPADLPPSTTSAKVYIFDCPVAQERPLTGGVSIDDFVRAWEAEPEMAEALAAARIGLANSLDDVENMRMLRMKAGMSQALLACRAETTQSQIALIESGARDPQTDMIARLASALQVEPARVFAAVRAQRAIRQAQDE